MLTALALVPTATVLAGITKFGTTHRGAWSTETMQIHYSGGVFFYPYYATHTHVGHAKYTRSGKDQKPATLSGGQKQRVTAIRALINDPQLILAAEPTGSLDEENAKIIMDLLKKLSREGKTVFTVTHDLHIASQHDKVLQLKNENITVKEN